MVKQKKEELPEIKDGTNNLLREYIEATRNGEPGRVRSASDQLERFILDKVKESIDDLYKNDTFLLETGMNEMSVSGRLAMYLQDKVSDFLDYFVDVEYYRFTKPIREVNNKRNDRIRCDILLHSRQHFEDRVDNLLAIEVKLEKSVDNGSSDICRLEDFVQPKTAETPEGAIHSTLLGLFLKFGINRYCKVLIKSDNYEDAPTREVISLQ